MSDMHEDPTAQELELRAAVAALLEALAVDPLRAVRLYETTLETASSSVAAQLHERFGAAIEMLRAARDIDSGSWERFLELYTAARRADRRRMLSAAVARLIELGMATDPGALRLLGDTFGSLVLDGTTEQRFCCSLGIALVRVPELPSPIVHFLVPRLIEALTTVLRIGAPRTAMLAVEAIGALLRLVPDPAASFHTEAERDGRIVLAIAGDAAAQAWYFDALQQPFEGATESAILQRAELLRVLPAVIRQSDARPR